jgi:competence protein ComGC
MEVVGEMKNRKFGTHTQAVAGVIEALLMVALVSVVISMIQLIYIPQIMEQKEAEHMDLVSNQVSTLKSMIDLQGITRSSAPISSMITLGSRDLPYFVTAKAFGEVSVKEDPTYQITLFPPPGSLPSGIVPLTSIQYAADNSYFVDQTYILEGGGLIVQQPDGAPVMRADPSISSVNNTNSITLHFDLIHIIAVPGKNSTNGEGNCFIRTNYSSNRTHFDTIQPGGHIRIYTAYPSAWNESLYDILGFYKIHGYIDITQDVAQPPKYVEIKPGTKDILIQLNVIDIYVQIGQGWIL